MTDHLKFDPEGLLPEGDESPKLPRPADDYTLWITGLTDQQFAALKLAVSPDPRNRTAKVVGKVATLSTLMVFVAGCIWTVSWILSHLPTY